MNRRWRLGRRSRALASMFVILVPMTQLSRVTVQDEVKVIFEEGGFPVGTTNHDVKTGSKGKW